MVADPITTGTWYQALPQRYRDRVRFDPGTGQPASIDVAGGAYTVPGELTDADRRSCGLPSRTSRTGSRQPWEPPR